MSGMKPIETDQSSGVAGSGANSEGVETYPPFNPSKFSRFSSRNAQFMTRAARAYFNGASAINKELVDFVSQRVRKDFQAARTLMALKNGDDAFAAQAEFVETTIRDYADETSKFFNLASQFAKEALEPQESPAGDA